MKHFIFFILIISLIGCHGRNRGNGEIGSTATVDYEILDTDILKVGLGSGKMSCEIGVLDGVMLLSALDRLELISLSDSSLIKLQLSDSGVKWAAGSVNGIDGSGVILMSMNPTASLQYNGKEYPGEILVQKRESGLTVINIVGLEQYLRGVLPWEIGRPGLKGMAALEAQAVAARTYSVSHLKRRSSLGFDMWDDVRDQVYNGYSGTDPLCDKAIENTKGVIMKSGGQIVEAYYCSTCGGKTSNINEVWAKKQMPYLISHPDGDANNYYCSDSKYFGWEESWSGSELDLILNETLTEYLDWVSESEIRKKWAGICFIASSPGANPEEPGRLKKVSVEKRTSSGRVSILLIETDAGKYKIKGDRTRWVLRPSKGRFSILKSAWFNIKCRFDAEGRPDLITAKGRGFGHGVGLCQTGALKMAKNGIKYQRILKHYYPGCTFEQVVK